MAMRNIRTSRLLIGAALLLVLDTAGSILINASDDIVDFVAGVGSLGQTKEKEQARVVTTTVAREEQDTWRVDMTGPSLCDVNQACDLTLRLIPVDGWRANRQFPTRLLLDPSNTVSLRTEAIDLKDDGTAEAHITVIPRVEGAHAIGARLRVSACNDDICRIGKHNLALVVRARS